MTTFPSLSPAGERRQARLADARLAAVVGTRQGRGDLEPFLRSLVDASVDVLRLRDDHATEDELRAASDTFRRVADHSGALFVLERLAGLAVQVGADGVHVADIDVHPDHARRVVGPDLLVGRTAIDAAGIDASADEDVDYLVVRRSADDGWVADLDHAARRSPHPWFVEGEVAPADLDRLLELGARRVVVEGCLDVDEPGAVCWQLRRGLATTSLV